MPVLCCQHVDAYTRVAMLLLYYLVSCRTAVRLDNRTPVRQDKKQDITAAA